MCDVRIIVCPDCEGDGGFEGFTGTYDRHTGAPGTCWQTCALCGGNKEIEVSVSPIEMSDLDLWGIVR